MDSRAEMETPGLKPRTEIRTEVLDGDPKAETSVAEWTPTKYLFCRMDAKPLLEAPCRPFCNTSALQAAKMQ